MGKKDELRDLNSQFMYHINDLKAFMCALNKKKNLLPQYSSKAETAQNQTQNIVLKLNDLQCRLNSHSPQVSTNYYNESID
jgi:hypothetical protein